MLINTYAERAIATISSWDHDAQLERLVAHLLEHQGVALMELALVDDDPDATDEQLARAVAVDALAIVETLPSFFARVRAVAEDRSVAAATRVSLLSVIAYVAQPFDAIPDDGSAVGFIDDAAVIYGVAEDLLEMLAPPGLTLQHVQSYLRVLRFAIPEDRVAIADQYIQQIRAAWQAIAMVPAAVLEQLVIRIYDDPDAVSMLLAQTIGASGPAAAAPMAPGTGLSGGFATIPTGPIVRSTPLGGSIMTEGDSISMSFAGGGGASMVGNDIVAWD